MDAVRPDRARFANAALAVRRNYVSADDFMTGLLSCLARRNISSVSLRGERFYEAIEAAYTASADEASKTETQFRFRVALDPIYRDSALVRQALSTAVQSNLISLDNPEYQDMRLTIGKDEADLYLESLPGNRNLYERAAEEFLEAFPFVVYNR